MGVFVDETMENVIAAVKMGAVKMVRLHGGEGEDFISELKSRGIPVIKAFQVGAAEDIAAAERSCADMVLLDSGKGSGQTFDWSLGGIKRPICLQGDNCRKMLLRQ